MTGKLYLIPSTLGDNEPSDVLPSITLQTACSLKLFVVEEIRTARRFLSKSGLRGHIDELEFHELNEHSKAGDVELLSELFERGDVGLISEAGLPAVADPGASLVALCHRKGIEVVPLVGPSSLMLALMASGLNGQSFAFCGYVPAKPDERRAALKNLEHVSRQLSQTQIVIETPYRNDSLLSDMLAVFAPQTRICIAADLTLPTSFIRCFTVSYLRSHPITVGKRPCVFVFLA